MIAGRTNCLMITFMITSLWPTVSLHLKNTNFLKSSVKRLSSHTHLNRKHLTLSSKQEFSENPMYDEFLEIIINNYFNF